ncbi:MAG: hypothetical protein ABIK92_01760 [Pseudomonadota bacterium]
MKKQTQISSVVIFIFLITVIVLYFSGYWQFNNPKIDQYPIRGIDVSHHQGKIDWNKVKKEDFKFVGNCKKRPAKAVLLKELFTFIREIEEKYGIINFAQLIYDIKFSLNFTR